MYYLYVLKSRVREWHYNGITDNINVRLARHNSGGVNSTKPYRPLRLVYSEEFASKTDARKREIFLKKTAAARQEIFQKIEIG